MLRLFGLEAGASTSPDFVADRARPAYTARPRFRRPEAAVPHTMSLGLSALAGDDDHGMPRQGFMTHDALYAWIGFAGKNGRPRPTAQGGQNDDTRSFRAIRN